MCPKRQSTTYFARQTYRYIRPDAPPRATRTNEGAHILHNCADYHAKRLAWRALEIVDAGVVVQRREAARQESANVGRE